MTEDNQFTYNVDYTFTPPEGVTSFSAIRVEITLKPFDGECLIYGTFADGTIGAVKGKSGVGELPFVNPQIYVRFLGDVAACVVEALSFGPEPETQMSLEGGPSGGTRVH